MEILIIGNGFDLAHKLPTQYKNFLEFCEKARRIYTYNTSASSLIYQHDCLDGWDMDIMVKGLLRAAYDHRKCKIIPLENGVNDTEVSTPNESLNELFTLIKSNLWLEYFVNCPSYVGENWIDFETEISRVIQILDEVRSRLLIEESIEDFNKEKSGVIINILNAAKGKLSDVSRSTDLFVKFIVRMDTELKELIRALEIYLSEFVGRIFITEKISEIENLSPDHVLSFNYTDTYERIYGSGKAIKFDYVHGRADINNTVNSNNMVLGIDEYLSKDREKEIYFVAFKKFYQRIFKETGCKYLDWVGEIVKQYDGECARSGKPLPYVGGETPVHHQIINMYIFGHSLDETDKDILQSLICNDNVHTKIFYLNDMVHAKQVANLVKVIGPDELIRRTGGPTKTIEFIKQK